MMKKYTGTEKLHNNEEMDKMFLTKITTRKLYDNSSFGMKLENI